MSAVVNAPGRGRSRGSPAQGLDVALNAIAGVAEEGWVRLNANTMQSVYAPTGLTSQLGPSGQERIQGAWPSMAWDSTAHRLIAWGGGHANSPTGQVFEWSAVTRMWSVAFHQADLVQVSAVPRYRSADFNDTPIASHTYGNNVWLSVLQRFLTFGGAAYGDGGTLRVYDTGTPGNQSPLRSAGAYTLDMTQAGTGKVAGATGSNVHGTGYTTTDLDGAAAWTLRDWFGQSTSHASRPRVSGADHDQHINCGACQEVLAGKDVVYYTAGSGTPRHLWKVVLDADPLNDVQSYVAAQGSDNSSQGQGPIALDPVRRVVAKLNNSGRGASGCVQFVDLKRTWGATNGWRAVTLTGTDAAAFAALSPDLMNAGIVHNPIKGCFTVFNMGVQVWEIYPPDSASYTDNSNANLTGDTWSLVKPTMVGIAGSTAPRSSYVTGADLGETGLLGKWRWAEDLNAAIVTFGNRAGEVWAYKPTGWTDPRA